MFIILILFFLCVIANTSGRSDQIEKSANYLEIICVHLRSSAVDIEIQKLGNVVY
ncbi:hypothetical protein [Microcoleus sp. Pol11C3]|uniref:hypothetical protein n=1 Tax=Microcoleus sp. Pol11C3 TaxID=3055390 RepID=UPI002FCEAAF2